MKPGDNVVCIHKRLGKVGSNLEEHKIYKIDFTHKLQSGGMEVRLSESPHISYNSKRFVSLIQYRKIKLNKLKEKIDASR